MKTRYFYIILLFLGLLCQNTLQSQIYFSRRYDFDHKFDPDFSGDILLKGTGYIVFTGAVDELSYYYRFGFFNIDSLGNSIGDYKVFEDSVYSLAMGFPGSFISNQNGSGYFITGFQMKYVPTGRWDRGMLWRFDQNLDTLWTRTYSDDPPHDTSFLFRNFRQMIDGGFIIVGSHGLVDGTAPIRINLHRVDSLGNLNWRKYYGSGNNLYYLPYDVSITSDGGFVIGGVLFPISGSASQDDDPILIKTDSSGNQQWLRHLGNPDCTEEYAMVDLCLDGNIIAGTIYSDSCWGSNDHFSKINIIKINNNNTIIWDKKYGIHKLWLRFNKIRALENGDIIATGHYDNAAEFTRNETSWILKTDSAGNELWYREYMLLTATFSQNKLYNVIPTPDNGFIACGSVWPYPPDTGTQDSWVLKVDSLGCEAPNQCWVGQEEIWVKTFTPEKPFIVYPNPATDKLNLEFHINPQGAELELISLTGQMVIRSRVPRERDLFEWDIGRLNRGMYILKVSMPGRRAVMEKVVVE